MVLMSTISWYLFIYGVYVNCQQFVFLFCLFMYSVDVNNFSVWLIRSSKNVSNKVLVDIQIIIKMDQQECRTKIQ